MSLVSVGCGVCDAGLALSQYRACACVPAGVAGWAAGGGAALGCVGEAGQAFGGEIAQGGIGAAVEAGPAGGETSEALDPAAQAARETVDEGMRIDDGKQDGAHAPRQRA